ncbi:MAG: GMP synthase [Bacteroidetes bacterium]|nr:GMP synthase [Bacteroidota bacterium]
MRIKHEKSIFKVAVLDLYNGFPNQGMRCINQILNEFAIIHGVELESCIFDVRQKSEVPDLSFDAYISTGGPGSPVDSVDEPWEKELFQLFDSIRSYNSANEDSKKHLFLICHSFQLYCRYYNLGKVTKRLSTSFGVMPVHMTFSGAYEPFFEGLEDPFWAVDSRDWQVVQPDMKQIRSHGGDVLCIEKYRPHVKLERCVMAMRFDETVFGTQFHPEADAEGMLVHLMEEERKQDVIRQHGEEKYHSMIEHLNDPDKIVLTQSTVIPNFLLTALRNKVQIHS